MLLDLYLDFLSYPIQSTQNTLYSGYLSIISNFHRTLLHMFVNNCVVVFCIFKCYIIGAYCFSIYGILIPIQEYSLFHVISILGYIQNWCEYTFRLLLLIFRYKWHWWEHFCDCHLGTDVSFSKIYG